MDGTRSDLRMIGPTRHCLVCTLLMLGGLSNVHAQNWPLANPQINQGFLAYGSARTSKNPCATSEWPAAKYHVGIDLRAEVGTAVKAVASGTVVYASDNKHGEVEGDPNTSGYGNIVVISHDSGGYSLYAHLKRATVQPPKTVQAGEDIGESGRSGPSVPHLHFELRDRFDAKDVLASTSKVPGYLCALSSVGPLGVADPVGLLYKAQGVTSSEWVKISETGYRIRMTPSPTIRRSELSSATPGERYVVIARARSDSSSCSAGWVKIQKPWFEANSGCRAELEGVSHDCFGDPKDTDNTAIKLPRYPFGWLCADATQVHKPTDAERALLEFFGKQSFVAPPRISSKGAAFSLEVVETGGLFTFYESAAIQSEPEVWDLVFLQHYFIDPPGGETGVFVTSNKTLANSVLQKHHSLCPQSSSKKSAAECIKTRLATANRVRIGGGRYDEGQRCLVWSDASPQAPPECKPY